MRKRGAATGWIQSSAAFGLLAALLVILATRTWLGEEAFLAWGWRIPFLASIILLAVSVWLRTRLAESPAFAKLKEEGEVCHTPLREAFAERQSLKRVAIAFFGIMCAQGRRLVLHLLLHAGLSRAFARRAGPDREHAGHRHDLGQRAALRVLRLA